MQFQEERWEVQKPVGRNPRIQIQEDIYDGRNPRVQFQEDRHDRR
jgi:hypothetical protein